MGEVELRKVQIAGGSTYTVSLPKDWAVAHGIRSGGRVSILRRDDGSLQLFPMEVTGGETPPVELEATKLADSALLRTLLGYYLSGHDVVLVRASPRLTLEQRETIRRFTRICIGPEIVEETGDRVLVRDLVNSSEFSLPNALNRVHAITLSMIQDALEALSRHDEQMARDVQSRDDEVDRLHRLVAKRFAKMLRGGAGARDPGIPLPEAQRVQQVSRLIERCADHACNLAQLSIHLKTRPLKSEDLDRLVRLGQRSVELFGRAFASFKRANASDANKVIDESRKLAAEKGRLREQLLSYGPQYAAVLSLLVESLERIHQYASDIAEVTLNAPPRAKDAISESPYAMKTKVNRRGPASPNSSRE